ncbi:MAG: hypothetical protein WCA98_12330 [Candidatus Acidiferrales bacterium]
MNEAISIVLHTLRPLILSLAKDVLEPTLRRLRAKVLKARRHVLAKGSPANSSQHVQSGRQSHQVALEVPVDPLNLLIALRHFKSIAVTPAGEPPGEVQMPTFEGRVDGVQPELGVLKVMTINPRIFACKPRELRHVFPLVEDKSYAIKHSNNRRRR